MPEPSAQAIEPAQRIEPIDILRGLALFGVLAVNLISEFRVSIFQQFLPPDPAIGFLDKMVQGLVQLAFEMKAFTLFSFLFGVGLGMQFDRLSKTGRPVYWLVRRLSILLIFGLVHLLLIWNGDILVEYALAGLLVLPLLAAPAWALAAASAIMFALYLVMSVVPMPIAWPANAWLQQHVAQANQIYAHGTVIETLRFSFQELPALLPLHMFVFPRTLALFLLGALTWRAGILQRPHCHKRLIMRIGWIGIVGGVTLADRHVAVKTSARTFRAHRPDGVHKLHPAVDHFWLCLLRLWSWPVRAPRCCACDGIGDSCLCCADVAKHMVVAAVSVRSAGVVVA